MCANFIYDLNGIKGPNTVGKDIGAITALYPTDSHIVAPVLDKTDASSSTMPHNNAVNACKKQGDEYRLPTFEEGAAIICNYNLYGLNHEAYWTSKKGGRYDDYLEHYWAIFITQSYLRAEGNTNPKYVRCVKR